MSDRLKEFIENNREGFDDLVPGDLWTGISSSLNTNTSSSLTKEGGLRSSFVKNLPAMLKYGFGASALILGTFLIITNQLANGEEKAVTSSPNTVQVSDSNVEMQKAPEFSPGAVSTIKKEEEKRPAPSDQTIPEPQLGAAPPDSLPEETNNALPGKKEEKASTVAKTQEGDSLKETPSTVNIDTIFRNIRRIEINVDYCNVNISAGKNDHVSVHGKISEAGGSYIVLGKRALKKGQAKLRYEVKDTVLKVWTECEKTNQRMLSKDISSEYSVLDFKAPPGTNVDVIDASGNISVNGLSNKSTHLKTSFGDIKASELSSSLVVHASSGNIILSGITGQIKSDNSFGNQVLEDIKGIVSLHTSSGNCTIKSLKGNADIRSSFGHQVLENISGNIVANLSSGNLTVKFLNGNANTKTSFGTQQFDQVVGDIIAKSSSGNIKVSESKGRLMLGTSFGNITGKNVTLVNGADFKTSSGSIQMQLLNSMDDLSFDLKASSGSLLVEKASLKGSSSEALMLGQGAILVRGVSSFGNQEYR